MNSYRNLKKLINTELAYLSKSNKNFLLKRRKDDYIICQFYSLEEREYLYKNLNPYIINLKVYDLSEVYSFNIKKNMRDIIIEIIKSIKETQKITSKMEMIHSMYMIELNEDFSDIKSFYSILHEYKKIEGKYSKEKYLKIKYDLIKEEIQLEEKGKSINIIEKEKINDFIDFFNREYIKYFENIIKENVRLETERIKNLRYERVIDNE